MPTTLTHVSEPVASGPRDLREILGNRRRVDARADIFLTVTADIVKRSVPRSQCHCVMANAVRNTVASGKRKQPLVDVVIRTSRAWLVYGDENTGYYERYELPKSTADQVKQYDKTGVWMPGVYRLKKMRPAATGSPSRAGSSRAGIKMPASQKQRRQRRTIPLSGVMLKRNDPSFYAGALA